VRGILVATDWDANGSILAVAVSTADEREYVIWKDQSWEKVLPLLRQEVEVSGPLVGQEFGNVIRIREFRLIRKLV